MERPRHGGEGAGLFDQDQQPERSARSPHLIPNCIGCGHPTLRKGLDRRPWHATCEPKHAKITDPETSHDAAARTSKGPGSALARAILAELGERGELGATDDELADVFRDQPPGSCAKRRCDLGREGLVLDSGRRRPTRFGRNAIVWVARG